MICAPFFAKNRGFSLLEVLVAFVILSTSLGVLLQIFATGLRNASLSNEYTHAVLYAESILAAYGREAPLTEGVHEGVINDVFSWRGTVSAYTEEMPATNQSSTTIAQPSPVATPTVYRITVEVSWQGTQQPRSVVLETLRLAPFAPPKAS